MMITLGIPGKFWPSSIDCRLCMLKVRTIFLQARNGGFAALITACWLSSVMRCSKDARAATLPDRSSTFFLEAEAFAARSAATSSANFLDWRARIWPGWVSLFFSRVWTMVNEKRKEKKRNSRNWEDKWNKCNANEGITLNVVGNKVIVLTFVSLCQSVEPAKSLYSTTTFSWPSWLCPFHVLFVLGQSRIALDWPSTSTGSILVMADHLHRTPQFQMNPHHPWDTVIHVLKKTTLFLMVS